MVTLQGELQWNYEKEAAQNSIRKILGIIGINNYISIKPFHKDDVEKKDIDNAITRNWTLSDKGITTHVSGNKVKLTGTVDSLYQKEEATRIAWNAKGVVAVENELYVEDKYNGL